MLDIFFVATKLLSQPIFVTANITLPQQKFCWDKLSFVVTNMCLLQQKILLSQQKYVWCDKTFVVTNVFVATNICCNKAILSQQK